MLPGDQPVVITVSSCHAIVCRWRRQPDGALRWECASNAADLENEALVVLARSGVPVHCGTAHPCPPELAGRAIWS